MRRKTETGVPVDEQFGIGTDYQPNSANLTYEEPGVVYWTDQRIRASLRYQWDVYARARAVAEANGVKRVLDVGCGPATKLMECLAPVCEVVGVDQPGAIALCRERYRSGDFVAINLENDTDRIEGSFGLIVCSDVVEHMVDPDRLLDFIRRHASADTTILISTPCRRRLRGPHSCRPPRPEHIREWTAAEFVSYLRSRGFVVERSEFLPPVRIGFDQLFLRHFLGQLLRGRSFRYSHLVTARVACSSG